MYTMQFVAGHYELTHRYFRHPHGPLGIAVWGLASYAPPPCVSAHLFVRSMCPFTRSLRISGNSAIWGRWSWRWLPSWEVLRQHCVLLVRTPRADFCLPSTSAPHSDSLALLFPSADGRKRRLGNSYPVMSRSPVRQTARLFWACARNAWWNV